MNFRSYDLFKLAEDFGETVTLRKKVNQGTYDVATGTLSGGTTTDFTATAYTYSADISLDSGEIRRGVNKCLIPALGLSVEPDDEDEILYLTGDSRHIKKVSTMFSNGVALGYICEVAE